MSFWRKLFGADDETTDVEFDDIDRTPAPAPQPAPAAAATAPGADGDEMPVELLDAILGVVNAQLPPVAAQCIDRDAQRRFMAAALGEPLVAWAETMKRKAVSDLTGDRAKIQAELDELRSERKEFGARRDEQKAALLSEQRQRRALSDRNRDLESKIEELAGEIEQHKLTIASLMNKMRVAEVAESDSAALRDDIAKLRADLAAKTEVVAAKDEEITALTERIAEMESGAALDAALESRRRATEADADEATPSAETPAAASSNRRRRGRPRKQQPAAYNPADDASADIDSVDWLLPGGVPAGHQPPASDPDFGYQPPKHVPAPDSDAQLTLF